MSRHNYLQPVNLPGTTIPCNLFLAPLAGFADAAFRSVCIDLGACFTFSEMVSAEGLIRDNKKTTDLLIPASNESMYGIQLFASSPESAAKGVEKCLSFKPALIDLNCGCPVPKVVRTGAGAALLQNPAHLFKVVHAMSQTSNRGRNRDKGVPITVKIRSGWDKNSINYLETAAAAVEGGASMVCLHARTRSQGYSGSADWEHITRLTEAVGVPVIGSGDLYTPEDAYQMIRATGCAGLIFARGAIGNPFIFQQTKQFLNTGIAPAPVTIRKKIETALRHYHILCTQIGESKASREIKKHFAAYTKGAPRSGDLRNNLMRAESRNEFEEIFRVYLVENYK